jgi:putative redox protein
MDAKVTWDGRLSFTGSADTGFTLQLGADPSVGGDNDGFRPMELVAIGLASCTGMGVISILLKKKQDVTQFEVRVHADRADEHPKVFTDIHIEYLVTGHDLEEAAVARSIELTEAKYCPTHAMLSKSISISSTYQISQAN